jgi:hypothetical protein
VDLVLNRHAHSVGVDVVQRMGDAEIRVEV